MDRAQRVGGAAGLALALWPSIAPPTYKFGTGVASSGRGGEESMLLWGLMFGVLAAAAGVGAVVSAMRRAEQRTRRSLLRTLGVKEDAIDGLMDHKGDLLSALELVRRPVRPDPPRREPHAPTDAESPERSMGRIRDGG